MRLEDASPVVAPDGSVVLPLVEVSELGSMVHCTLAAGRTSLAVRHSVISEIWYFIRGFGEMWRQDGSGQERVDECQPGLSLTIPDGVSFQFRNTGDEPLEFLCVTMPPWPGAHVAAVVDGKWQPSV